MAPALRTIVRPLMRSLRSNNNNNNKEKEKKEEKEEGGRREGEEANGVGLG